MKIEYNNLKRITENILTGLTVYYNPETSQCKNILFDENHEIAESSLENWKEIQNWGNKIMLKCLDEYHLLRVMEDFAYTVEDAHLQDKLLTVLKLRSPVYNFREIIKNSEERDNWYHYIFERELENVKTQLELEDIEIEEIS